MYILLGLIALSLGYGVYLHAMREKDGLRLLGQVIAIFVMITALLMVMCGGVHKVSKHVGGGYQQAHHYPITYKAVVK